MTYRSRWHTLDRVSIQPRPSRAIPVWLGGFSDTAHDRASRIADGFIFARTATDTAPGALDHQLDIARSLLAKVESVGRDPTSFGLEGRLHYTDAPAIWSDQYEKLSACGFSHATISLTGAAVGGALPEAPSVPALIDALSTVSAKARSDHHVRAKHVRRR